MSEQKSNEIIRNVGGTIAKGSASLNPGGRPKVMAEVVELAREHTPNAMARLQEIINDPKTNAMARVKAIEIVFDRAYGRPAQALDVTGMGTQVLAFTLVAGKAPEEIEQ